MSIISTQMSSSIKNGSWIRRMFEAGIQLKQKRQRGSEAAFEFFRRLVLGRRVIDEEGQGLSRSAWPVPYRTAGKNASSVAPSRASSDS